MKLSLGLFWGCALALAQNKAPKLIDCHVHHNGEKAFLDQLISKLDVLDGMALLITAPADMKDVSAAISNHPGRLVGLGEIQLDDPKAVALVDRFHEAGFRRLGEITGPVLLRDLAQLTGLLLMLAVGAARCQDTAEAHLLS
jgi:hypothetical protein